MPLPYRSAVHTVKVPVTMPAEGLVIPHLRSAQRTPTTVVRIVLERVWLSPPLALSDHGGLSAYDAAVVTGACSRKKRIISRLASGPRGSL